MVTLALRLLNQRDELIHEGDVTIMVERKRKGIEYIYSLYYQLVMMADS